MPSNQAFFSDTGYESDSGLYSDTWYKPLTDVQGREYMFYDEYWISPKWNQTFTDGSEPLWMNLEEFFNAPPNGESVPQGTRKQVSLNGRLRVDGAQNVTLSYNSVYLDSLVAYCEHLWGSNNDLWNNAENGLGGINNNTGSVPCTITLKQRDRTFRVFNAWAYFPQPDEDYEQVSDLQVSKLNLRFRLRTS